MTDNFGLTEFDTGSIVEFDRPYSAGNIIVSSGDVFLGGNGFLSVNTLELVQGVSLNGNGRLEFNDPAEPFILNNVINVGLPQGLLTPTPFLGDVRPLTVFNNDVILGRQSLLSIAFAASSDVVSSDPFFIIDEPIFNTRFDVFQGSLQLDGGSLLLTPSGPTQIIGEESITIATASEGINGAFGSTSIAGNYAIDDIRIVNNALIVDIRSQIGANAALSTPAGVYAAYLDDLSVSTDQQATLDLVGDIIAIDDPVALEALLRGISAEPYAAIDQINTDLALSTKAALATVDARYQNGRFEAWTSGFVSRGDRDAASNGISGADTNIQGGFIGAGYQLTEEFTAGGFVGVTGFSQRFDTLGAAIDGDGFVFGAYARLNQGPLKADALLARSTGEADTSKSIPVLTETALAQTDIDAFIGSVDLAYELPCDCQGWAISPVIGLTYVSSERGEIEEQSAGALNLSVARQDTDFLFADAGLAIEPRTGLAGGVLYPSLKGGYRQEILGNDSETFAGLASEEDTILTPGLNIARGRGFINAGVRAQVAQGLTLSIVYDGEYGDSFTRHGGQAALTYNF